MATTSNLSVSAGATNTSTNPTDMGSSTGKIGAVERRCENADCNVVKLVSMVPKRKNIQFVTEPTVMEKPMLINGFTTIFQVDGGSAKLGDLKGAQSTGNSPPPKTIFRIVPNTHAHIVNYVVVDADGDSLRKINESDPATMRKLLDSQKNSADQMLKKLMAGHGSSAVSTAATNVGNSVPPVPSVPTKSPMTMMPTTSAAVNRTSLSATTLTPLSRTQNNSAYASSTSQQIATQSVSSIQLPMRMHPNLKITAVASADAVPVLSAPTSVSTTATATNVPTIPLITPVPLASLQSAPSTSVISNAAAMQPIVDKVDKPVFDKMQAELQELRRTVALLAEAQAKNQQAAASQPTNTDFRRGIKRTFS